MPCIGSNCAKWSGGSMDFKSSNTGWLWAFKGGSPIKDDSASADISQHDDSDEFTFDLTKARGGSSINPFVVAAAAPSGSTTAPAATGTSIAGGTSEGSGYSSGGSGSSSSGKEAKIRKIEMAHGTLMSLAFVIFLPMGAMIIRLLSFRNLVWVHAGIQIFAYTMALAGMGLGVYLGVTGEYRVGGPFLFIHHANENILTGFRPAKPISPSHWAPSHRSPPPSTRLRPYPPPHLHPARPSHLLG